MRATRQTRVALVSAADEEAASAQTGHGSATRYNYVETTQRLMNHNSVIERYYLCIISS